MTTKNQIQPNFNRQQWQSSITLIIGNGMSEDISHAFGVHHQVITPADLIKMEQQASRPSNGLHIFVMKNLASVLRLVYSCPRISMNPLSVLWCPQIDQPTTDDLMECAKSGIAFVPSFAENRPLAMSIIEGRLKATALYQSDATSLTPWLNDRIHFSTQKNERFANLLNDYLEVHFHDEQLCIDQMGQDLGMSRTNFFNKVKSMTGASPSRFVMAFRLTKAKEFLQLEGVNVSDVAFKVGFSSTSYFAKCFKEFFNTTPTAFMQSGNYGSVRENQEGFALSHFVNRQIQHNRNIRTNFRTKLEHTYNKKEHN